MAWEKGITVIPGLWVIPDSRFYDVRDEHVDLVVGHAGEEIRCCIVSKFNAEETACLDVKALADRIRNAVLEETCGDIEADTVTFTGSFHFPRMTLKRFTEQFDVLALGECVSW